MVNRLIALVLGLSLLGLGIFGITDCALNDSPAVQVIGETEPLDSTPLQAPAISRAELQDPSVGPWRIIDKLTEIELTVDATIVQGQGALMHVSSGDSVDLSLFDSDALIQLDGRGEDVPVLENLGETTDWTGSEWRSILPYNSGLIVRITGVPQGSSANLGKFLILQHPSTVSVDGASSTEVGPFVLPVENMTLEGKVKWLFRKGSIQPIRHQAADPSHSAEVFEPIEGLYVVLWVDNIGNQAIGEVSLLRGQTSEVVLAYKPRPTLSGRLLDWDGNPVPNGHIKLIVNLDLDDYDLMPMDPHAFGAVRADGVGWVHTVSKKYKTEGEGFFSYSVPRGKEYAIQSYARNSYVFWSTLDSGMIPTEAMNVELVLLDPTAENSVRIKIVDPEGLPLVGAKVLPGISDDLPFMRQWPELISDAGGVIDFVGLEPGQRMGFLIKHHSFATGACLERVVIPTDRVVSIQIPRRAYTSD